MKKFTKITAVLMVILLSSFSMSAQPFNTLVSVLTCDTEYQSGTTNDLSFNLAISTPEYDDFGTYFEVELPAGFTPMTATTINYVVPTIVGNKVIWDGWFYYSAVPENFNFFITVDIDGSVSGPQTENYLVKDYLGNEFPGDYVIYEQAAVPGAIEGYVRNITGQPIHGAQVTATIASGGVDYDYIAYTSGSGHYIMQGVVPGVYDLQANASGYFAKEELGVTVQSGDPTQVDFTLDPLSAKLEGYVYEADQDGQPIQGATITADGIRDGVTIQYTTQSDENGFYQIIDMVGGSYNITAEADCFDTFTYQGWNVPAGYTTYLNFDLYLSYYLVTTQANPTEGGTTSGDGTYQCGTEATVNAYPNTDWFFINWTEGGVEVSTNASFTFTVANDITLVANFEYLPPPAPILISATPGIEEITLVWEPIPIEKTGHFDFGGGNAADPVWTIYIGGATVSGVDLVAGDEIAVFDGETMVGVIELIQVCNPTNQFENALPVFQTLTAGPGYTPGNEYSFKAWSEGAQEEYDEFEIILSDPYGGAWTGLVFPAGDGQYSMVELDFAGGPLPTLFNVYYEDGTLVVGDIEALTYTDMGLIAGQEYCYYVTQILEGGIESAASNIKCATPEAQMYTVTTEANPPEGGTTTGDGTFAEGTMVTVMAYPNTDWEFINWTVDGIEVSIDPSYTFTLVEDILLVANFEVIIIPAPILVSAIPGVEEVSLLWEAIPEEGTDENLNEGFETWPPVDWTIVQGECSPTNDITQNGDEFYTGEYSARFSSYSSCATYDEYLITPELNTTAGDQTISFWYKKYTYGSEMFTIGWSSTGTNVATDFTWGPEVSDATVDWQQYVNTELPVGTKFVAIHYYSPYMYYLYLDDVEGPALATGSSTLFNVYYEDGTLVEGDVEGLAYTDTELTAGQEYCYYVTQILEGGIESAPSNIECATPLAPTEYIVTTEANPPEGGTTAGDGIYEEGTDVTVYAYPNTDWEFINWTVDGTEVSIDAEYTFAIMGDILLVANFEYSPPPEPFSIPFCELWDSGDFETNYWTPEGNWTVATTFGNPLPSAKFGWSPQVTSYSLALSSWQFDATALTEVALNYDLYLSNYSLATIEGLLVEVYDGAAWYEVANYTNVNGSIPWTSFEYDISAIAAGNIINVRFVAYGEDSYNINNWNIDNICLDDEVPQPGPELVSVTPGIEELTLLWEPIPETKTDHFNFEGGSAADPVWTIYLGGATVGGTDLVAGDEIAVFDGDLMVGVIELAQICTPTNQFDNAIPVFSTLTSGPGYTPGNAFSFIAWSEANQEEYPEFEVTLSDPYGGAWMELVFPTGDGQYSMAELEFVGGPTPTLFNVYYEDGTLVVGGVEGNTYTDMGLIAGDEYCYFVTQILEGGTESGPSNVECGIPEPGDPIITYDPDHFDVQLYVDETTQDILNIGNIGAGPLDYNVSISYPTDKATGPTNVNAKVKPNASITDKNPVGTSEWDYDCPDGSMVSNPCPDYSTAITADEAAGYDLYQSFTGGGEIQAMRFWGIDAFFDGAGWAPCTGTEPKTFHIGFFADAGGQPGGMIQEFTIEVPRINTGDLFAGAFTMWEYEVILPSTVNLIDGWFSVMAMTDPGSCWFLGLNAPSGSGTCQQWDGSAWNPQDNPFGFCLIGEAATPWLSVYPTSGTVLPENSDALDVMFDATGLDVGTTYYADIIVYSNDPITPVVTIPVSLEVLGEEPAPTLVSAIPGIEEVTLIWEPIPEVKTGHFNFEGGSAADPVWTIYLGGATVGGTDLVAGDEIAVFDGDLMVGVIELAQICTPTNQFDNAIPVFSTLTSGPGYTPGNAFSFIAWSEANQEEYPEFEVTLSDPYGGAWMELVFPTGDGQYSMAELEFVGGPEPILFNVYYEDGTLVIGGIEGNTYTDMGLIAGQEYCYYVTQILEGGIESAISNVLCATPDPYMYSVTTEANPPEGGTTAGDGTFAEGTMVTVNAYPNTDWEFINWTVDGVEVSILPEYTFTLVEDILLVANFEYIPVGAPVLVSATPGIEEVSLLWEAIPEEGTDGNLNEGFETWPPVDWTIVQGECSPTNDITQNGDEFYTGEYSARFSSYNSCATYDEYLVTPELNTTAGDQTISFWYKRYTYGSEVFTVGWSSTGTNVATDFTWGPEVSDATVDWQQYVNTDLPVGTKYVAIHYYSDYMYYFYVDDVEGPALATGSSTLFNVYYEDGTLVEGDVEGLTYTDTELTAGQEYCYYVTQILEGGIESEPSNIKCATPFPPTEYTVTTEANPPEGGTTTGDGIYEEGTEVTVYASPNTDWEFINWTVDGTEVSIEAEYTFTIMGDILLVANFEYFSPFAPILVSATAGIEEITLIWEPIPEEKTGHFIFEGGSAADPVWTIYLGGATVGGTDLVAGDEIAVFDGDLMVGVIELAQICTPTNQFDNAIPVFSTLTSGPGYTPGNAFSFIAWSEANQEEYPEFEVTLSDPYGGAWMELVFPTGDGQYSMAELEFVGGPEPTLFNVYYEDGTLVAGEVEGLTYTDIGLSYLEEYCYYVTQILEGGNESPASNVLCETPIPPDYTVTTEANPPEGGTTAGDGVYSAGTEVTVYAYPNTNWDFINWTVDGVEVSILPEYTFFVEGDILLVANFEYNPPMPFDLPFCEYWDSGDFETNNWTPDGDNWSVDTYNGNPEPSAKFNWSPQVTNYSVALSSWQFDATALSEVALHYDLFLSNYSLATIEGLSVEVFDGTTWYEVANYTNENEDIPWTSFSHDVSQYVAGYVFNVRFTAYGEDSYNINNWNIDNICLDDDVPQYYTVLTEANPPEGGTTAGDGTFLLGTEVTVNAYPNTDWEFINWTVDGVEVAVTLDYTFTLEGDILLVANFEYNPPLAPILVSAEPGIEEVTLLWEAIPEGKTGHFNFEGGNPADPVWTIYIGGATVGGVDLVGGDEIAIFDGDLMVGVFELTQVCTPTNQFENAMPAFNTLTSGPGYVPGNTYSFKAWSEGSQMEYDEFDITLSDPYGGAWMELVFPTGDGQYSMAELEFVGGPIDPFFNVYYEDGTLVEGNVQGFTYTDIGLIGGQEYCYYVTQILEGGIESAPSNIECATPIPQDYTVTTEAIPYEGGTTAGDGVYAAGTEVTVYAYPNTGWEFINWTVDGYEVSIEAEYTFFVESDIHLVANFEEIVQPAPILVSATSGIEEVTLLWEAIPEGKTDHFMFEGGDPSNPVWTVYIGGATFNGMDMEAGDEVGVYDGDLLVGAFTLDQVCTSVNQFDNDFIAFSVLTTQNGYQSGNTFTMVAWDESAQMESMSFEYTFSNPYGDAYTGDVFPVGDGQYSMAEFEFVGGSIVPTFNIYYEDGTLVIGGIEGTTYTDMYLIAGQEYCYYVTQILEGGIESAPSNIECAIPTSPIVPFDIPFCEGWDSDDFETNNWTPEGNWMMSTIGNPAPSAMFHWSPQSTNYSFALTSWEFDATALNVVNLTYDLFLNNYSLATIEGLSVEVFDGTTWYEVANYTNENDDIPWTSFSHDVSQYVAGYIFNVRFTAYGEDTYNINNWNIDNICLDDEVGGPIITTINDVETGDTEFVVPITVENFMNVAAISLTMNYNMEELVYVDYQNVHPAVDGMYVYGSEGQVSASWQDDMGGATIPNDEVLFELVFAAVPGIVSSTIEWDVVNCEYADPDLVVLEAEFIDGLVTILSSSLSGYVYYGDEDETGLINTDVGLVDAYTLEVEYVTQTDEFGFYQFDVVHYGEYIVTPIIGLAWNQSANSTDALAIMYDFVGTQPLYGLYWEAGDVTDDGVLNAVDALAVQERYIGFIPEFPAGDWITEANTIDVPTVTYLDVMALYYGDVDGGANLPFGTKSSETSVMLAYEGEINLIGDIIDIPVSVKNSLEVGAVSLVFNYPASLEIIDVTINSDEKVLFNAENGELSISWASLNSLNLMDGEQLINIAVKTNNASNINFTLNDNSELADATATAHKNVIITMPSLLDGEYSLSNYPNPFNNTTNIQYVLPEDGYVTLNVYNLHGELIKTLVNSQQAANNYEVKLDAMNIPAGVYTYRLEVQGVIRNFVLTNRMVITE